MKKLKIFAILLFIVFAYFPNSYAGTSYRQYEISQIRSDGIVIKDFEGVTYLINEDPGDLKVGDYVKYDRTRHRLRKSQWQPAIITKMTDRKVTLKFNSGEELDVNMKSKYRGKYIQGDQILYKETSGQIKKSKLQKLDNE